MNDIAFDKILRGCAWVFLIGLAGFVGFILWVDWATGKFTSIPNGHDARFLGWWTGKTHFDSDRQDKSFYRFDRDGHAYVWGSGGKGRSVEWGTDSGRLQFKYMATDAWSAPKFAYSLSDDRNRVTLNKGNYMFAQGWTRCSEPSAQELANSR